MHALFVFAHQDDEIAMAARITQTLRAGASVSCAYLTDGEGRAASSDVRDEESRRVLTRLGVDLARVHFLGSRARIPDGRLVEHLPQALELLERAIPERVDEIYCLSWEGGHQDHDASHLVAVAFAKRRGIVERCFEMPLYHGHLMPGPFFNALAPLRVGEPWSARRLTLAEGLRVALLCRVYRSQRRTWLGLLPGALVHLAVFRREWSRRVDPGRLRDKPHGGTLFYERRFGVSWEDFASRAKEFLDE